MAGKQIGRLQIAGQLYPVFNDVEIQPAEAPLAAETSVDFIPLYAGTYRISAYLTDARVWQTVTPRPLESLPLQSLSFVVSTPISMVRVEMLK